METLQVPLNDDQLDLLTDLENLLNNLFELGTDNYHKLAYELQREFRGGGSPDVMRINFDRIRFDENNGNGSFRVMLDIGFTFGCEDVRVEKQNQTSEWTFAIDKTTKTITLYSSPYAGSRSTADEF
ncbi:MAG TPA: hypothetical protein VNW51_06555 [Mucilaginibacter sp.]|jgi:hypothetical protein|nr:hypothetical protein [Mucilaginibacter sp.]